MDIEIVGAVDLVEDGVRARSRASTPIINDPDTAKTNANQCNRKPAIVIDQAAAAAGMKLTPENIAVDDGLKKESA